MKKKTNIKINIKCNKSLLFNKMQINSVTMPINLNIDRALKITFIEKSL